MKDTPTPRTDEAAMPIDRVDTISSRPCSVVHEDVYRQLERELADAIKDRDEWKTVAEGRLLESLDEIERLAEAREQRDQLAEAARAVVDRWETPLWKDAPHTGLFIRALADALDSPNAKRIHGGAGQPNQLETPTPLDGASC